MKASVFFLENFQFCPFLLAEKVPVFPSFFPLKMSPFEEFSTLLTMQCTLHNTHCALNAPCTVPTTCKHCILHTTQYSLQTTQLKQHDAHYKIKTSQCTLHQCCQAEIQTKKSQNHTQCCQAENQTKKSQNQTFIRPHFYQKSDQMRTQTCNFEVKIRLVLKT